MFLDGMDEVDQKIVQLLIKNARMSYSDIGQQVGISRVAVKSRIKALEEKGVIEEYTAIINPQKISGAVSCYFEIELSPEHFEAAVNILRENPTITQIYRVTGGAVSTSTRWPPPTRRWTICWPGLSIRCRGF